MKPKLWERRTINSQLPTFKCVAEETSQRRCVRSTGRRSPQGVDKGPRALRHRAERKTVGPEVWRQKTRSLGPGLKLWRRRKGKESKEGKDFHLGERESGLEEGWGVEMDLEDEVQRVARSWMSKRGNCRRSCEILKSSLMCRKSFRETLGVICNSCCKRWSKGEHQKVQKRSEKDTKHSGKQKNYAKRKCCSTRGDAEDQRGNGSQ